MNLYYIFRGTKLELEIKAPKALQFVNILLILFGCGMVWLMSMHHSIVIAFLDDPFSRDKFHGYFLAQPHIKAIYSLGLLLLVGKEFFLKKPIKINMMIDCILPMLFWVQFGAWYFYFYGLSPN